jgi:hypothetical protein
MSVAERDEGKRRESAMAKKSQLALGVAGRLLFPSDTKGALGSGASMEGKRGPVRWC